MEFSSLDELKEQPVNAIIYGEPGTGKTSLANHFDGQTFILDLERGLQSLDRGNERIKFKSAETIKEAEEYLDLFEAHMDKFNNFVLDSASTLEEMYMLEKAEASRIGTPGIQDYNKVAFFMKRILRRVRKYAKSGINVIVTAHQQIIEEMDEDGVTRLVAHPKIRQKLAQDFEGLFDVVGRVEISTNEESKGKRWIRFASTPTIRAKDRIFKRKFCKAEELLKQTKEK